MNYNSISIVLSVLLFLFQVKTRVQKRTGFFSAAEVYKTFSLPLVNVKTRLPQSPIVRYVNFVRDQKLLLDKAREQLNDQSHVRDMEAAKGSSDSSRYNHGYVVIM